MEVYYRKQLTVM